MLANLVLIGFMGSGKSSVGRHLAALTGHRFVDTDELVTAKAGCSIPEIFAERGEEYFRDLETACLQDLIGVCGIVLATGGGLVLREQNRELLRQIGTVTWLDADPDVIFERVSRNNRRPLLATDNPRETFDRLRSEREELYRQASDVRLDTTGLTHEQAAKKTLQGTRRCLRRKNRAI